MKLLVTGFDGFQGHDLNPSWEMLRSIPTSYGEHEIVKVRVDTTWAGGGHQILAAMRQHQPDAVLSFGLSGSHTNFKHETVGVNFGGTTPDNDGVVLNGLIDTSPTAPIGGPSTVSASTAISWSNAGPVKGAESASAGTYICNHASYLVGRAVAPGGEFAGTKFIFTHVPADSLDWRYSSAYKKQPVGDMARTAAAMIRGMFRDHLGVPEITGWGPVAVLDIGPQLADPPWSGYFGPLSAKVGRVFASFTDGVHGVPRLSDFNFTDTGYPPAKRWEGWAGNRRHYSTGNNGMTIKVTRETDGVDVTVEKFGSEIPELYIQTWPLHYPDKLLVIGRAESGYENDLRSGGPYIITLSGLDLLGNPFETNMRLSYPESNKAGTYELIT